MVRTKKHRPLEFKQQIVNEVLSGKSPGQVARENDIHPSLISKWVRWHQSGELSKRSKLSFEPFPSLSEEGRELQKLQAELKRYKEKVGEQALAIDLLKKALEDFEHRKSLNGSVVTGSNWDPSKGRAK